MHEQVDHMRIKYGFWIILMGFFLIALITAASILKWNDVTGRNSADSFVYAAP